MQQRLGTVGAGKSSLPAHALASSIAKPSSSSSGRSLGRQSVWAALAQGSLAPSPCPEGSRSQAAQAPRSATRLGSRARAPKEVPSWLASSAAALAVLALIRPSAPGRQCGVLRRAAASISSSKQLASVTEPAVACQRSRELLPWPVRSMDLRRASIRLSVAKREELLARISKEFPSLLVLAVDRFPLAAGFDAPEAGQPPRLVLQAVCCTPPAQRLDAEVSQTVRKLAEGERRPMDQLKARLIEFLLDDVDDNGLQVQVSVNWFDCIDFRSNVLKGSPGCVEVLASDIDDQDHVLAQSPDWNALRVKVEEAMGPISNLVKCSGYLSACTGPLQGMLFRAEKQGRALTPQELAVMLPLAERVAAGCAPDKLEILSAGGMATEASTAPWHDFILELRGLAKEAPGLEPRVGEALEAWCEDLRSKDYRRFLEMLAKEPVPARPPLQAWLRRLRVAGHPVASNNSSMSPPRSNTTTSSEVEVIDNKMDGTSASVSTVEIEPVERRESLVMEEEEVTIDELSRYQSGSCGAEEELPMEPEVKEMLENLMPRNSEVVLMQQVGSFMYDLQIESSDRDFRVLYLAPPESILSVQAPRRQFSRHVNRGFGADKRGDVEYTGNELGVFVEELARGNPRNVELLFSKKAAWRGWAWKELRASRRCFLTLRCVNQYLGFIADRLKKLKAIIDDPAGFAESRAAEASKLLYHAHHKLHDCRRILDCKEPSVQMKGEERDRIMQMRLHRPGSVEEVQELYEAANAQRRELHSDCDKATEEHRLPAEVDGEALLAWLRSVRRRSALKVAGCIPDGEVLQDVDLGRSRSEDDRAAICDLLAEVEATEGVYIVYAGYEVSSRTIGTAHSASDHDVRCIFVHPRSAYFGLQPASHAFKHEFPAGACSAPVDISGWEARHAMQMLAKSSIAVLGALQSPIAFRGAGWQRRLLVAATAHFDRRKVLSAWFWHAQQNFNEYILRHEEPIRKKYVHVLRPLLSVMWLRRRGPNETDWPPLELAELLAHTSRWLSDQEITAVNELLEAPEALSQVSARLPELDALIEKLLLEEAPPGNKSTEWQPAVATPSSFWHDLCVELVSQATTVGFETGDGTPRASERGSR